MVYSSNFALQRYFRQILIAVNRFQIFVNDLLIGVFKPNFD
ncbi:hypothetical protein FLA105534_02510 [Flavobacterium bizetiae]|uniref:Uncharacterized protein n=1 Tax=Flavobacterium bizetiae TaxID=2704140 RepID=A0A6J4GME0_9FLAO|nr:hypothetical protein FLA105534_02510 [Flavobacterium bizetiae]CAD5342259.1 hypothetical protein FLA105535_02244 [Flavobacterium bizetiae]CAD5348780.1 hypothetical protein FLA105534_02750 [Flavobacterium bizetiae]